MLDYNFIFFVNLTMFVIFMGSEPESTVVQTVPVDIQLGLGFVGKLVIIKGFSGTELGVAS